MNSHWATINNDGNQYLLHNWYNYFPNDTISSVIEHYGNRVPYNAMASFTQSYSYDSLNRLTSASDSGGYSRSFGYDAYGNMWVTGASGGPWSGSTPTANNFANNRMNGISYDAAGNQLAVNGDTLTYDAENGRLRPKMA